MWISKKEGKKHCTLGLHKCSMIWSVNLNLKHISFDWRQQLYSHKKIYNLTSPPVSACFTFTSLCLLMTELCSDFIHMCIDNIKGWSWGVMEQWTGDWRGLDTLTKDKMVMACLKDDPCASSYMNRPPPLVFSCTPSFSLRGPPSTVPGPSQPVILSTVCSSFHPLNPFRSGK